jgi:DNA polymerase III subunit epsilon
VHALQGTLAATHVRPRLVLAPHPRAARFDAFWLVGGRVADWDALDAAGDLHARTLSALARGGGELVPDAVAEARIVQTWLAGHDAPALALDPPPTAAALHAFVVAATAQAA